jgi:aldehyde:ferredoxin oxidoreductase
LLRVNLSTHSVTTHRLDPAELLKKIGGRGLNSQRLIEELPRGADPLDPESPLLLAVGPLTGTLLTGSAYTTITARSPLTGILGDAAAGGHFGAEMKCAGVDQVVIEGRADVPSYIFLSDEKAEIRDATHLWGTDIWTASARIRAELGDNAVQVAGIGPAGENLVKFATVACNNSRMFGRTGMGCVFGSKNLKAIAVRGTGAIALLEPTSFSELCRGMDRRILDHPEFETRKNLGTTMLMTALNGIGILPTDHFQKGVCAYVDQISGEQLAERYKVKNKSCFNCNVHCSRYYISADGEAEGPEFETLCSYTSRLGNSDLEFALRINRYLSRMGLDSISSAETIGWAMECQQRGLLSPDDLDGMDFSFGNRETIGRILELIVYRRGIGDAFAEGARSLSRKFGRTTEQYAFHVKGLDLICGDPRGIKAYGLTYAIASRGGDHLRAEPFFELTQRYDEALKRFGTRDAADRLSENGKARLVHHSEKIALLTDSLTMCKNIGLCMDILDLDTAAALLRSGTGLPFSAEGLEQDLGEMITADRRLNLELGLPEGSDTLPRRFTHEALEEGPTKGSVVDIDHMVREYYALNGWDSHGYPPEGRGGES